MRLKWRVDAKISLSLCRSICLMLSSRTIGGRLLLAGYISSQVFLSRGNSQGRTHTQDSGMSTAGTKAQMKKKKNRIKSRQEIGKPGSRWRGPIGDGEGRQETRRAGRKTGSQAGRSDGRQVNSGREKPCGKAGGQAGG